MPVVITIPGERSASADKQDSVSHLSYTVVTRTGMRMVANGAIEFRCGDVCVRSDWSSAPELFASLRGATMPPEDDREPDAFLELAEHVLGQEPETVFAEGDAEDVIRHYEDIARVCPDKETSRELLRTQRLGPRRFLRYIDRIAI